MTEPTAAEMLAAMPPAKTPAGQLIIGLIATLDWLVREANELLKEESDRKDKWQAVYDELVRED